MHSQFTRKMYKGGCTRESIELYLQQGVLLRIITDTYAWYSYMLTTLAGYVSKLTPGELWGDSVAGNLLKIHEKELGLIRSTSACYREMVLRNYICMRDQSKTSFWNNKVSKKMALVNSKIMARLHASGPGTRTTPQGNQANRSCCDICKRNHQGRPCPVSSFTPAQRAQLGTGLIDWGTGAEYT